jgi:hypothetical protein
MSRRFLYILIGVVVLLLIAIGVGAFVILPSVTSAKSSQTTTTTVSTPTSKAKGKANPLQQAIQQNAPAIRTQIAEGLHITAEQLKTQLEAGQTLDAIATAQGVSSDQLQTLIQNAFEQNLATAVKSNTITQKQVDAYVVRLQKNATTLERFLGAGAKKTGTTTKPTVTATPTT